jgi:hypothetical protein
MKRSRGKAGSPARKALAAVLLFALAALPVFLLTRAGAGEAPPMPRASFPAEEARSAVESLRARAAACRPEQPDGELERLLADLGRLEAGVDPGPHRGEEVARAMKAFSEVAQGRVAQDREHYLGLGDRLAERFGRAVDRLLEAARREGLARARAADRETVDEIERLGGSFLSRAVERGVIGEDGSLGGPAFLPEVLFLTRWRALAGLDRELALTPLERRAHLGFLAAFSSPAAVSLRLEAVQALGALDPAYDALLARAVVLHEAGRDVEAHAVLMAAIEAGRDDPAVVRFARLLSR